MKRLLKLGIPGGLCAALILAAVTCGAQGDAPAKPYEPSLSDKVTYWIDTRTGRKTVKPYHLKVHQGGTDCTLCHGAQTPSEPPSDTACIRCHGTPEQLAEISAKKIGKDDPNPHDSPHYRLRGSCTGCHKEHDKSEPLCTSCHPFKFKNFKE
ncbi:cytochrome c3 family protein [Desulfocurvus sp. DL9XJH121]